MDNDKRTVYTLAAEMAAAIESLERMNGGDAYYALRDGSPEWMRNVVRAAHNDGNLLPSDHRYAFVRDAVSLLDENRSIASARLAIEPDVYTSELTSWLGSSVYGMDYLTQAMRLRGVTSGGILLQEAQMVERKEVFDAVVSALRDICKGSDENDD